jgi:MFS transporter, ACS family, D-galactonate transporter
MTGAAPVTSIRAVSRIEWFVLWLLVISVCINYVDRGNLSVASVDLASELHLQPFQLGVLLSAFFWTYSVCLVISGWLIDRYNVIWVYGIGFLIWSGVTALTGLVSGFTALFVVRLLLGMSESVAYPSYSKIICSSFPEQQRGMANGLIDAGSKLGPAVGLIVGGTILAHFGWRTLFVSIGLTSVLWIVPWCLVAPRMPRTPAAAKHDGPGFLMILSKREAWGTLIGLFGANYAWYFMLTWIPGYLRMERHYSVEAMAWAGSLPFFTVSAGALLGGWLSDKWIRACNSPTLVRKTFVAGGLSCCAALLLPAAVASSHVVAMMFLSAATFLYGFYSSNLWAVTQTLAGPAAAGKWTGLQNGTGNLAGLAAASLTGFIVQETHSFYLAFVVVSTMLLISALSYLFIVRRIQQVCWDD